MTVALLIMILCTFSREDKQKKERSGCRQPDLSSSITASSTEIILIRSDELILIIPMISQDWMISKRE